MQQKLESNYPIQELGVNIPRLYETAQLVLHHLNSKGESIPYEQLLNTLSSLRRKQLELQGKPDPARSAFAMLEQVALSLNAVIDRKQVAFEQLISKRLLTIGTIEQKMRLLNLADRQKVADFQTLYAPFLVDTAQRYPQSEAADRVLDILMKLYDTLNPPSDENRQPVESKTKAAGAVLSSLEHPHYTADKAISKEILNGRGGVIAAIDGVGSGDESSADAASIVQQKIYRYVDALTFVPTVDQAKLVLSTILIESALEINRLKTRESNTNIDTTVSIGIICLDAQNRKTLLTANVGDSRVYRFQPHSGEVTQLTTDHSRVALLVQQGLIKPDEAFSHPERNVIYRSVGDVKSAQYVEFTTTVVQDGDVFFAVSDGVTDNITKAGLQLAVNHEYRVVNAQNPKSFDIKQFARQIAGRARNIQNEVMRLPPTQRAARQAASPHIKQDDICVAALQVATDSPN